MSLKGKLKRINKLLSIVSNDFYCFSFKKDTFSSGVECGNYSGGNYGN